MIHPCPHAEEHSLMESCPCGYTAPKRPFATEEPAADLRTFARSLRGMYVALVQEGFTPSEALVVIGQWLAALRPGGDK